jgi:Na+-driven multidrug efflux pump
VLGIVAETTDVAHYAIASRVVLIIGCSWRRRIAGGAPFRAILRSHDREALVREATRAVGFALALTIVPILVLTIAAGPILTLFGAAYAQAAATLRILMVGNLSRRCRRRRPNCSA